MDRRKFTKYLASGSFLGIGGGVLWLNQSHDHSALGLDLILDRLDTLSKSPMETIGSWGASRTLHHLAQSIEFSMSGFPEPKSPLFQKTAGKLAFKVFSARGAMTHGLDEVVPGEVVTEGGETQEALQRLKSAVLTFKSYEAELMPHFAYGALDKNEYAVAHALHINNHLEEFRMV